jgi:hypothetical protein
MAVTPAKGYELIVTGTLIDTWGDKLNTNVFTFIDSNLGGIVTKSLTNVQVDLSATESQALRLVLTGTLTGNVLVTTQAVGMTIIENGCTGAFTVTFQKNGVGSAVTIPNGTNNLVTTGASGNPALIGIDFPSGTRIPFQQTTPPAGYSKDTSTVGLNNSAMRMASQTPTGTVGNTALDTTQIPAHGHPFRYTNFIGEHQTISTSGAIVMNQDGTHTSASAFSGTVSDTFGEEIGGTGGGQVHTHSLTMNAINLAVRYFDFVIGVKA